MTIKVKWRKREREGGRKTHTHTHTHTHAHTRTHTYSGLLILPKNCMCTALSKDRTKRFKEVVAPFSRPLPLLMRSFTFSNQSHNHSVQVEEEHQQVETQLQETLSLVLPQSPKDLSSIQKLHLLVNLVHVVCK